MPVEMKTPYPDSSVTRPYCTDCGSYCCPHVELAAATQRIKELEAELLDRGMHTCSATCNRPGCKMRRERDSAHQRIKELEHKWDLTSNTLTLATEARDASLAREAALREALEKADEVIAFYANENNTVRDCMALGQCANCDLCTRAKEYMKSTQAAAVAAKTQPTP